MEWPVTFKCNNDCISCILDTRQTKYKGEPFIKQIRTALDNVPTGETINLTGGEPTLRKEFFEILKYAREKNPDSLVFVVSNGRKFADEKFVEKLSGLKLENLRIGIALYSHKREVHDKITQAKGSWLEAVQGIKNLIEKGFNVELRVLVEKCNYQELEETARFITENFIGLERVVFINLKYTGNAFINRKKVFVHYSKAAPFAQKAVNVLAKKGFQARLFHFPLCIIEKKYRPLAEGTTKGELDLALAKKCRACTVKEECPKIWKSYLPLAGESEFKPVLEEVSTLKKMGGVILHPYCSNHCVFCNGRKPAEKSKLIQEKNNVYRNLLDFQKAGISKISISGGDPIEYEEIISLIKNIKKHGFQFVKISTHGRRLADKSFLEEFIRSGIDQVRIPLYGSTAKVHDSITRSKGSFDETLKGIRELLKKSKIQVQISSLITKQNKDDLLNLIDLLKGLEIKDFYFSIPCILKNKEGYSPYYIPIKDLQQIAREVYQYSLKKDFKVKFAEIPFCVFGLIDNERINNTNAPPNLGKYCQPPDEYKTRVKDLPSYRIKTKPEMCSKCRCFDFCDGFFTNDFKIFGTGNLEPITRQASEPA